MTEQSFVREWRARLGVGQHGVKLIDAHHPLEIYAGAGDSGMPLLQIRSKSKPPMPELSDLVSVSRHETNDRWVLSLHLQDARFTEIFLRLTAHLVSASHHDESPGEAWRTVAKVLDAWKRLLRTRPPGLLSLDELRGLVGELWMLLNKFAAVIPLSEAIHGWLGPLGAPQDFWYEDTGFHETKTIGPTAPYIKISSAEQLDEPDMALLVLQVPQVSEGDAGATNLVLLVQQAADALLSEGAPVDDLQLRLKRLGVELDKPFYADTWFSIRTLETFRIVPSFPAIRASDLARGIERVRYSVDRREIAPFLLSTEHL